MGDWQMRETNVQVGNLETVLIQEFKQVLMIEEVDRESNFYACGGDSLSMVEFMSRLEVRFDLDCDLSEIPMWADISEIAQWLERRLCR